MAKLIGTKYYDCRNISRVYRVINLDSKNNYVTLMSTSRKEETMTIPIQSLKDNYIKLNPDGFLAINTISNMQDEKGKMSYDVLTLGYLNNGSCKVIARQNLVDVFSACNKQNQNDVFFGMSIFVDTFKGVLDLQKVLSFDESYDSLFIQIYLDDTEEDLINVFKAIDMSAYDKVLSENAIQVEKFCKENADFIPKGLYKSYIEFFEDTQIMFDIHRMFGIVDIDIDLDKNDNTTKQFIIQSLNQNLLIPGKIVTMVFVQPYSKEIDLNLIKRDYVLMNSTITNKKYIVGYETIDSGITIDKEKALRDLGFNII